MSFAIIWDIETVPDLTGFARATGLTDKSDIKIRESLDSSFPKPAYHSIVWIGAVVSERIDGVWIVGAVGAPHVGERSERELVKTFLARVHELHPKLVTYNGSSFDLPVLRYRAMLHQLGAPGLFERLLCGFSIPVSVHQLGKGFLLEFVKSPLERELTRFRNFY